MVETLVVEFVTAGEARDAFIEADDESVRLFPDAPGALKALPSPYTPVGGTNNFDNESKKP